MFTIPTMVLRRFPGVFWALLGLLVMVAPAAAQNNAPPPVVRMEVMPQVAKAGDTVTIAVRLENVTELYGLQVVCQVDPAVMVAAGHVEGDAFASGSSYYVDPGMKPDGKWLIAATRLQPNPAINGNGTAFSFQYVMQTEASATFTCDALGVDSHSKPLPLTLVNATPVVSPVMEPTVEIPTAIPTVDVPTAEATAVIPTAEATEAAPTEAIPTVESTPEATLVTSLGSSVQGAVTNPYAPDSSGAQVVLTLNGSLVQQTVTGADGTFSFAEVPAGHYVVAMSAPGQLSMVQNVVVAGDGAPVMLAAQTFVTGDTDGNQTIDLSDAALVSANFDLAVPPAPEGADLNRDGAVNISDLVLIGANFGLSGPVAIP